ncbi:PhzF family phenazine biosynthesis protein [Streptomyces sp. NPDC046915]|uniref:PhzF family phenazine biosynthesis protein n=1 Tax=Streptomyces sp. NPDC046915 TaxID=3155257 RepID=UPI0033D8A9F2
MPEHRSPVDHVPFALVDVFADTPLTGNPLAVVDVRHLDDAPPVAWMRKAAREFNQAETTFVVRPKAAAGGDVAARLRSFTAGGTEVFGAGHNALGAWWWLFETGRVTRPEDGGRVTQQIGDRESDVLVLGDALGMVQELARFDREAEPEAVADALGLRMEDLDLSLTPRSVDTGAGHLLVAVADTAALTRCAPEKAALVRVARTCHAQGVYAVAIGDERPVAQVSARFFNPGSGLDEDPATGSAAGPLCACLDRLGLLGTSKRLAIAQGESMARPSVIDVHLDHGSRPVVTGRCAISVDGRLSTGPMPRGE